MVLVRIDKNGTGAMTTVYSQGGVVKETLALGLGRFAVAPRAYHVMTLDGLIGICRN